jgi:polysaccharide biosynthesis protein PslG
VSDGSRFGRRTVVAVVVAVIAGAVVGAFLLAGGGDDHKPRAPAPTPAPPTLTPERPPQEPEAPAIGVSVNWLFNGDTFTPAQVEEQLDAMQADGVKLARTDAFWSVAEPEPPAGGVHRYDWGYADRVAGSLSRHGVRWLPIIDYSALWAASLPGNDKAPPRSADDYAAYARAFAQRYGREGRFWAEHPELPATPATAIEIWNEPDNSDFWAPAPDPAAYIDLYLRARAAIRTADPQARVLVGGLTGAPTFLPQLLAARPDARGQVDGVAIHTYSPEPLGALAEARDARRTLVTLGMADVPLWVTEFGWVSHPRTSNKYAPPAERPERIASTTSALARSDCNIEGVVLYAWITPGRNPRAEGDWYGIRGPDGGPTASSRAFSRVLAEAASPPREPAVALCSQPG